MSQQAFRKRQSAYIKDLERRLEIRGNEDNEQIARLERDNRALREQLTTACSKLERIQITLRSLSESMLSHISHGSASDVQSPQEILPNLASEKESEDYNAGNGAVVPRRSQPKAASEIAPTATYQRDDEVLRPQSNIDGHQLLPPTLLDPFPTGEDCGTGKNSSLGLTVQDCQTAADLDVSYLLGSFSDVRSLPGIWTHEYQMGLESFQFQSPSADKVIQGLANTNSSFSDHMRMIRCCLKMQWRKATRIVGNIETTQVIFRCLSCCHELT